MYPDDLPKAVSTRIRAGELPSVVLRSVLEQFPDIERQDLGPLLTEAFDDSTLIHLVWNWRASRNSDAHDTRFNIWVISYLLSSGISLPWDLEYCNSEERRVVSALALEASAEQQAVLSAVSYETLVPKIQQLEGSLACVQALWDGDSSGWHIGLSAVMSINGKFNEAWLGTVKLGTDFRLFNSSVPPWPEAEYAADVGRRLAENFGAEFYFPSPLEPKLDQPTWVERQTHATPGKVKRTWWRVW